MSLEKMSDDEIRQALALKKKSDPSHSKYMDRLDKLHKQARMHRYGRSGKN